MRDPAFDPPQETYESGAVPEADARATPSMAQYIEIKAANPDCLLFYRMGDFYELFFEDAEIAARTLNIVLTRRGKHAGMDIPMCGVPVVRSDDYLQRLIAAGHRVAVCEQMEDPAEAKKRGSKSIVKRDVVRIVTPGTITEDGVLDARRANLLTALARTRTGEGAYTYALAVADISTGFFQAFEVGMGDLTGEIARLEPSEMLIPDAIREDGAFAPLFRDAHFAITRLPRDGVDPETGMARITRYFGIATLESFGTFSRTECAAMGAIIGYLDRTQREARAPLLPPARASEAGVMMMDAATRANLELTRTLAGQRKGSVLDTIDRTMSAGGARLLADWLAAPLLNLPAILARQAAVSSLFPAEALRKDVRERLKRVPDVLRALTRLLVDRGGPRDLQAVAQAINEGAALGHRLRQAGMVLPQALERIRDALEAAPLPLAQTLHAALAEDVPLQKRDGGFIRPGFDAVLDGLHALQQDSRGIIAAMQARYAEAAEAKSLKIKHNNVLGYFIEVPQQNAGRMLNPPLSEQFIHRQTMAGALRFSTRELSELDQKIAEAGGNALNRELAHFADFVTRLRAAEGAIRVMAEALAALDVFAALAELAARENYTPPKLSEDATFRIIAGRHPVVEAALKREGQAFIANDCDLSPPAMAEAGQIRLVTGANMAGKSTYLRQNALIAILAQMGSFVPAKEAEIGLVDRLFSRVGAADDLARGRSTFMVEMVETAAILNLSGARALVILDEIGRGTATYDGLSIAWAAIEHLHNENRCRALFATHFHELTALTRTLPRLHPVTMKVAAYKGDVVFLHEVIAGAADRSYGIQVAKLAGLPAGVVKRAGTILAELERADRASPRAAMIDDLPLFRAADAQEKPAEDALRDALAALEPEEMSPREALDALYRLKGMIRET
jgi:DNA mismatch repair protein MutS